jgi:ribosomal protein S18 acetylase RimI-like enzyme
MAAGDIAIVEATDADVDLVAAFFWTAWKEAGPDAPGWAGATDEAIRELSRRDNLLGRVGGPARRMFLAKEGGRVLGFSALRRMDEETVELAGIVVRQRLLGRGLGSRLLDAAVDAARRDGYHRMRVRTEANNERAIAFYEARGFSYAQTVVETIGETTVECQDLVRDL